MTRMEAERCEKCGTLKVESDAYLAQIMRTETHWFCPKGCDIKEPEQ